MSIKKQYILIAILLLFAIPQVDAQLFNRQKKGGLLKENKTEQHIDMHTLTVDENINIPIVESPLAHRKIREYMAEKVKSLQKLKQYGLSKVELLRGDEVIKVTIPMDKLFYPNDTTFLPKSDLLLRPIARYGEEEGMYHILVVTHSDDTGSIDYCLNLTSNRADRLLLRLKQLGVKTKEIVAYAMGSEEPVTDNLSMESRRKNRRTEIYLIPGEEMIKLSLRGRLEIK